MKIITNTKGLTLVELLLSIAISGIILATIMQHFTSSQNNAKNIASIYELISIKNNIRKILSNPNSCKATLGGYAYDVLFGNISAIISKEDIVSAEITLYESNSNVNLATAYGNKLIKIKGFQLKPIPDLQPALGGGVGYIELVIEFWLVGSSTVKTRRIRLEAVTDTDDKIVNCSVNGVWNINNKEMAKVFCETSIGGTFMYSHAGLGRCGNLSIEGSITALNTLPNIVGAAGVKEFEEIAEYICDTLGGSFFALATGIAGVGECRNLKPYGDLIINSRDTSNKLILNGGDIFMY